MNLLKIEMSQQRLAFEPGQQLSGTASWRLDHAPRAVELRLFWFTRGKGTEEADLVEVLRFDHPLHEETRPFHFQLPTAPYSFSGKLISLVWALELVAEPSQALTRIELILAPGGQEVRLDALSHSSRPKSFITWNTPG